MSNTKHPVVVITHLDSDDVVYCWGKVSGMRTVRSCLSTHPDESIEVQVIKMTKAD